MGNTDSATAACKCVDMAKHDDFHERFCEAVHRPSRLYCTRPVGHVGDHVACAGPERHRIRSWPVEHTSMEVQCSIHASMRSPPCGASFPKGSESRTCMRPANHRGDHVACVAIKRIDNRSIVIGHGRARELHMPARDAGSPTVGCVARPCCTGK